MTKLILYLIIIVVLFGNGRGLRYANPHPANTPPDLWLASYVQVDNSQFEDLDDTFRTSDQFSSDYVSKNGSDYVISGDVQHVIFSCQAKYPIVWDFPNKEQLLDLEPYNIKPSAHRSSNFYDGLNQPLNDNFEIKLTLLSVSYVRFLSFDLRCIAAGNPQVEKSIYVYVTAREAIERQGETIQVYVGGANRLPGQRILLPCRPALPDLTVELTEQDSSPFVVVGVKNKTWQTLDQNVIFHQVKMIGGQPVTFDPKVGFTLDKRFIGNGIPPQLFKCSLAKTDGEENEYVFVNVSNEKPPERPVFEAHVKLEGGASVKQSVTDYEQALTFCSSSKISQPFATVVPCSSYAHCELVKFIGKFSFDKAILMTTFPAHLGILNGIKGEIGKLKHILHKRSTIYPGYLWHGISGCARRHLQYGSSLTFSQGQGIDVAEHYLNLFRSEESPSLFRNGSFHSLIKLSKMSSPNWNPSVEEKVLATIGKPVSLLKTSLRLRGLAWKQKSLAFRRYNPYHRSRMAFINFPLSHHLMSLSSLLDHAELELIEEAPYEGELIYLMCFSWRYFYADGGHVRLNWKNGTTTVLEVEDRIIYMDMKYTEEGSVSNELYLKVGKAMPASSEMDSFDCFVPVWNSTKWDKLTSGTITVQTPLEPRFSGPPEEIVHFALNDTQREIYCDILEGTPMPTLKVMKDGKVIRWSWSNVNLTVQVNNNVSSGADYIIRRTITFINITHDVHGSYECIAENVKGKAVKIITVFVTENSHSSLVMISCGVGIGILTMLLLGLGAGYYFQRRKATPLRNR